jgi:uncharacterized protein (TIGR02996 family)
MNQDEAFQDDIREHPDDDAPRLIYADWLEERNRGDDARRAEFIRVQCALEHLPRGDPRRRVLEDREQALLREHESAWAALVRHLVNRWRFRRGFVEEVTITAGQFLRRGAELFRCAPVRHVRLRETRELPNLLRRAGRRKRFAALLAPLRGLDLALEDLSDETAQAFLGLPRVPHLEYLNIRNNLLGVAALRNLAKSEVLDSLKSLECGQGGGRDKFTGLSILLASPRLGRLTDLGLTGMHLDDAEVAALVSLPLVARITALRLGHRTLGLEGVRTLAHSRALANLTTLDLSFNSLPPDALRVLSTSPHLSRLGELNLSRTGLSDHEALSALVAGPLMSGLLALDLSLNRLTDELAAVLASYPNPCRLAVLDVIYNRFTESGIQLLRDRFGDQTCLFRRTY